MQEKILSLYFFLFMSLSLSGQNTVVFKGWLYNTSGKPVEGASVVLKNTLNGSVSGVDGSFILEKEEGGYILQISHTLYMTQELDYTLNNDSDIHVILVPRVNEIETVEIYGNQFVQVDNSIPGMITLKQSDLISQPSLLGVPDVISVLQKGGGVQSVSEGIAGLFVRGGDAGQNMFIYDDMELVDPSHLLGAFSSFNPYLVERVDFYKGNSPVQYADRLSSTVVVHSYDNVEQEPLLTASLGTLASTLAVAYQNDKFGVVIGARRTQLELYKEVVLSVFKESERYLNNNNYRFYDTNGKVFYDTKNNDKITLSWYMGGDKMLYSSDNSMDVNLGWNNVATALSWKHTDTNYALNTVIGYTNYQFEFSGEILSYALSFNSKYNTYYVKQVYSREANDHLLTLSSNLHVYRLLPQKSSVDLKIDNYNDEDRFNSTEYTLAIGDNWQFSDKLNLYLGLRANVFAQFGTKDYTSINGMDTSVVHYDKLDRIKHYLTLSPQIFLTYKANESQSYKMAYSHNVQNMHRASLATLPLPADMWITSSKYIKPEYAHILSFGTFKHLDQYELSTEIYGKVMQNLLLFEPNISGELNANFEDNFKSGNAYALGLEMMITKTYGSLTGSVAYSLTKCRQRISGLNDDQWFNAKYDRVHDLSIVANYKLSERWDLSSNYVLASGNTATVPSGRYYMMGFIMNDYDGVNTFRLPMYSRLDIGVNYHLDSNLFKSSVLNLSVINVLNRANTYFFFYETRGDIEQYELTVKPFQFSLFPILPSISWTFKF